MKKRLFTLIAVMGLSLALVACSGGSKENVTEEESTQKQAQSLVIEEEDKDTDTTDETEDEAEKDADSKDDADSEGTDAGETTAEKEDWSDFEADTILVDDSEVGEKCIIFDEEYAESFLLDYNHKDEVAKIEFYELLDQEKTIENDFSDDNMKQYDAFYGPENEDLENDELYIQYSVPETIPNLVVRFISKGGNVKDYYVAYNGRDGGANLIAIDAE